VRTVASGIWRIAATGGTPDEIEFRDGMHGAAAWALATLLTAVIAFGGAQSLTRLAAPSTGTGGSQHSERQSGAVGAHYGSPVKRGRQHGDQKKHPLEATRKRDRDGGRGGGQDEAGGPHEIKRA